MESIADAHSIYGIERIRISPTREDLLVEYDASRLLEPEVGNRLCSTSVFR